MGRARAKLKAYAKYISISSFSRHNVRVVSFFSALSRATGVGVELKDENTITHLQNVKTGEEIKFPEQTPSASV